MSRFTRKLEKLADRDASLRELVSYRILRANLNWPDHQQVLLDAVSTFSAIHPHHQFYVTHGGPEVRPGDGSENIGESWVILNCMSYLTGKVHRSVTGKVDRQIESGAQLVFHFTHSTGLFQVYLHPPILSDSRKKHHIECLIWYSTSLDRVDSRFAYRMIKRMLAFQRVESSFQLSYGYEKLMVRYWRFIDARNRRKLLPEQHLLLTGWELAVIAGVIAAGGFLVSLLST